MDPDENLPWPDAALVTKWWNRHRPQFQAGGRYLRGKEIATQALPEVLTQGNQRERAAAVLELAVKSRQSLCLKSGLGQHSNSRH